MFGGVFPERGGQFQPGLAVDIGVVEADQYRKAARRHPFDIVHPFDDVDLPGCAFHIDTARHGTGSKDAQLTPVTGLRQADMAHMVLDIEILILQPVGVIQLERRLFQTAAEVGGSVQPVVDVLQDILVPHQTTGRGALVAEPEAADHHRLVGGFKIEEVRIHRCQLFHRRCPR